MKPLRIIVAGCHAGPNPSPGLGTAHSLRLAFPDAHLVAKDHSPLASGLHAPVFDEVWLCPPWDELDLTLHRKELEARLEGGWLITGLDLETEWLATTPHPRILIPPRAALCAATKPAISAAETLPLRQPRWIRATAPDSGLAAFGRSTGWNLWVKGKHHEARRVRSWPEAERAIEELGRRWGAEGLFLQEHVSGLEESLAFAALEGRLLEAAYLHKNAVTETGKAWAGTVSAPAEELRAALREVVRLLNWSGGGELEAVRDERGDLWLLDWNPRFPAWIHGATLAGINLPAALIAAASGIMPRPSAIRSQQFIRTVTEIPVHSQLPLPIADRPAEEDLALGKHPSAVAKLAPRLVAPADTTVRPAIPIEAPLWGDLLDALPSDVETPVRVFLPRVAEERFAAMAADARRIGLTVAYSIKTNPAPELLELALGHGFLAEAISQGEVDWALTAGFSPAQILSNGPLPWRGPARLRASFADSVESFALSIRRPAARTIGIRVRLKGVVSRFGVDLGDEHERREVIRLVGSASHGLEIGVSMHVPEAQVGRGRWVALAHQLIDSAVALERDMGRPVMVLNFGGGWAAESLGKDWAEALAQVATRARTTLGQLEEILIEPGRCLAEPTQVLLTRVVEVREVPGGGREAVLDASIAEVPTAPIQPHRMALHRGSGFAVLARGTGRLLGRSCMENDVLADHLELGEVRRDDLLAILDVGAYDASMAYRFGCGAGQPVTLALPLVQPATVR